MAHDYGVQATEPKPQPMIDGQVAQIEGYLHSMFDQAARIQQAVNRLVTPEPASAPIGNKAERPINSIETRLSVILEMMENLDKQYLHIADRMDSAV